jgi:hypothetical protein
MEVTVREKGGRRHQGILDFGFWILDLDFGRQGFTLM